jgi:hypothetical protein
MCRIVSPKGMEFNSRPWNGLPQMDTAGGQRDCGIRAHEPLYWANEHGLMIITDHHLPDEPKALRPHTRS